MMGTSSDVIVSKLDKQIFSCEFDPDWELTSYVLVTHLNKSFVIYDHSG